jgi:hypothetical protein
MGPRTHQRSDREESGALNVVVSAPGGGVGGGDLSDASEDEPRRTEQRLICEEAVCP